MSYRSELSLKDRVAIVTGGCGGIGFETSKALQENGATVVISDINAKRREEVAQELEIEFFPADVIPCFSSLFRRSRPSGRSPRPLPLRR